MKNHFIFVAILTTAITLQGCASAPTLSPKVTAMAKNMTESQAIEVLRELTQPRNYNGNPSRTFITGYIGLGLCNANQFSPDEERGLELQVTKDEISFNAIRTGNLVRSTSEGRISSATDMTTVTQYQHIPYREHLKFGKIESAMVYEPRLLRTICNRQNNQSEVVIHESSSLWYAALIPTSDKELFMAALLRLKPDLNITTEPKDTMLR